MGIGDSHFTHVFIDESGHGTEPECLVAIAGLLRTDPERRGQLVLTGDPKQLGPVLRSRLAIDVSLLILVICGNQISKFQLGSELTGTEKVPAATETPVRAF